MPDLEERLKDIEGRLVEIEDTLNIDPKIDRKSFRKKVMDFLEMNGISTKLAKLTTFNAQLNGSTFEDIKQKLIK